MYSKRTMKQRVLLQGVEGLDLLHRISSADIKRLKLKEKTEGLFLTPTGRIRCWFEIERIAPDQAFIAFAGDFAGILDSFTFGEQYTLTPANPEASTGTLAIDDEEQARILSLRPAPGLEFSLDGTVNPLEVNLNHAIADQKGCYPGQEVIEKILALGSPARRLCQLRAESELPAPPARFWMRPERKQAPSPAHRAASLWP
jgi:folate-binding protein YgfZ